MAFIAYTYIKIICFVFSPIACVCVQIHRCQFTFFLHVLFVFHSIYSCSIRIIYILHWMLCFFLVFLAIFSPSVLLALFLFFFVGVEYILISNSLCINCRYKRICCVVLRVCHFAYMRYIIWVVFDAVRIELFYRLHLICKWQKRKQNILIRFFFCSFNRCLDIMRYT